METGMNLHSLKATEGARHRRKRVGRGIGSGMGKTSGRGHKGQMARKGHKHKQGFEGGQMRLVRRLPKRGFTSGALRMATIRVGDLAAFEDGAEVTMQALKARGLVRGGAAGVKILGDGEIDRRLVVKAQGFSASARAKIEARGGVCEVVKV